MHAVPPISISQAAPSSEPAHTDASEPAAPTPGAGAGDFARALSDAGGKAPRKHAAAKQHDGPGGSPLPAPGIQPPLTAATPPPATPLPAAAQPTGDGRPMTAAPSPVTGADTAPGAAPGAAPMNTAPQSGAGPETARAQAVTDMAAALAALAAAAEPAGATPAPAAGVPAAATPVTVKDNHTATMPAAPVISGPKSAAPAGPAAAVAGPAGALTGEIRSSKAEIAAATSGQSSADGRAPANDPAPADGTAAADAAAQSLMAGAMARDTNASSPLSDSPAPADDLATPDTGAPSPVAAAANAANAATSPATALAAAAHTAAASTAAGGAATAASFAQAMRASADAGVDKRRDNSPDSSSTSGVSNDGSAGAAQLLTANSSSDAAPVPTFKVSAGLDTPDFGQGLADRVSMMMDSSLTGAKLQVNPPALGPIEVRIALQGGHAQVWLSSHSAVTRDALESSAPKLREMLGSQGFGQVSVDISQRSFQERSPQPQPYEAWPARGDVPGIAQTSVSMAHSPNGLLDAYA
ncbi:MAG TPA: flagellar hook-length control protein FliK [Steroidobacteraceae bacterium]|jgi:flagellar hook-length control protein FliK|nr:flagellar hook-length control protein FliK [Steroidobacteraceae bacterium]